jgi:hypothetical protein
MSETRILITACVSMLVVSAVVAGALFWLNAGPVWVVFGGSLAGIAIYAAIWIIGGRHVTEDVFQEEQNA